MDEKNIEICIICTEELSSHIEIEYLQCFHKFHLTCIKKWINIKPICPVCKFPTNLNIIGADADGKFISSRGDTINNGIIERNSYFHNSFDLKIDSSTSEDTSADEMSSSSDDTDIINNYHLINNNNDMSNNDNDMSNNDNEMSNNDNEMSNNDEKINNSNLPNNVLQYYNRLSSNIITNNIISGNLNTDNNNRVSNYEHTSMFESFLQDIIRDNNVDISNIGVEDSSDEE
jgi:hypothetical protein